MIEEFESRIEMIPEAGCWIWMGAPISKTNPYGRFGIKSIRAHRKSWELYNGPIPQGMLVCHTCDTPMCVNPKHLFLGYPKDNSRDMVRKGRSASGDRHGSAKLSKECVDKIRLSKNESQRSLAKQYSVSPSLISLIVGGKIWIKNGQEESV